MVEKYPIGIAGPDLNQISREYTGLVASSTNFVLAMLSNSWRAFLDALKESEPALLIVYADIATGPDALKDSPVQAAAGSGDRPAAVQLGAVSRACSKAWTGCARSSSCRPPPRKCWLRA